MRHKSILAIFITIVVLSGLSAAANWTKPQTMVSARYTAFSNASVNANGTIAAIWAAGPLNTTLQVQARVRVKGASWTPKIALTTGLQLVGGAAVAVAPNNDVLAVWATGYAPQVAQGAFFTNGKWGEPFTISLPGLNAGVPVIAFDGQSMATIVWEQNTDSVNCSTMASTGSAVTGIGGPQTISASCNGWLKLAINKSGQAVVVSGVSGPNSGPIVATSRDQFGVWSPEITISSNQYLQREPSVGLGDDGTAVVVWSQRSAPAYSKRDPSGVWSSVGTFFSGTNYGGTAAVAVDGSGNAVAAFDQYEYQGGGYIYPAYATYMPVNGVWDVPVKLTNGYTVQLQAVATPAGSFVVGWADSNGFSVGASTLLPGSNSWSTQTIGAGWPFNLQTAPGRAIISFGDVVTTKVQVSTEVIP